MSDVIVVVVAFRLTMCAAVPVLAAYELFPGYEAVSVFDPLDVEVKVQE